MPVVDLYIPDRLPVVAEYDLAHACAAVVDAALVDAGMAEPPCLVYVHRIAVFAVVSAEDAGVMTLRASAVVPGPAPALGDQLVRLLRRHSPATDLPAEVAVTVVVSPVLHQDPQQLTTSAAGPGR